MMVVASTRCPIIEHPCFHRMIIKGLFKMTLGNIYGLRKMIFQLLILCGHFEMDNRVTAYKMYYITRSA